MEEKEYHNRTEEKASWGHGPWIAEPDKVQFVDKVTGLPCLIVRNQLGALCGYVGVDENHPWYGVDYDSCPQSCDEECCTHRPVLCIDVHTELTFSDFCHDQAPEESGICHVPEEGEPDHVWWFGFDCAHAWDYIPGMKRFSEEVIDERNTYKDISFVKDQCAKLAKQLKDIGKEK